MNKNLYKKELEIYNNALSVLSSKDISKEDLLEHLSELNNSYYSLLNNFSKIIKTSDSAQLKLRKAHETIKYQKKSIEAEQKKSNEILYNTLPKKIIERLKNGETFIADKISNATVIFLDVVNFTSISRILPPQKLVSLLDDIFCEFDRIFLQYNIEKIKTIGDCYMAATGIFENVTNGSEIAIKATREAVNSVVNNFNGNFYNGDKIDINIHAGINTGELVAGIIGHNKLVYDLWGETVNLASRLQTNGQAGKITISESTYSEVKSLFNFEEVKFKEIKSIGKIKAYTLSS